MSDHRKFCTWTQQLWRSTAVGLFDLQASTNRERLKRPSPLVARQRQVPVPAAVANVGSTIAVQHLWPTACRKIEEALWWQRGYELGSSVSRLFSPGRSVFACQPASS
ncbi:hypothetical protein HPB52_020774 [Rhipicephalus sanguineus]|uniref:Uncharacterized protein n=1 Tax=Rhipicephalus sanguineus TaxID=34632 RepID=A0A9D4Q2W3_RHISA|nr:hypothetical protein HPB52_020774 [Rhipicephalus sanguineus]